MSENLIVADKDSSRKEKYEVLLPQLNALVKGEDDLIANVSNIIAAVKETFNVLWVGIYFVRNNDLVLGPFQGPIACTRIAKGKGVCGAAWVDKKVIMVGDVDAFPGHIACSSLSKSEIVVPGFKNGEVNFVLDVDSILLNDFNETDANYLQQIVSIIEKLF